MTRIIIAVADATRARLFTFERTDEAGALREALSERTDLVHPSRRLTPAQLFSDTRTNTGRTGGRFYGEDDHRSAHIDEIDAEFARAISTAVKTAIRDTGARRVIVCAAPRMLGMLRTTELRHDGVIVEELARDYVKMKPAELRELLADHKLLPEPLPRAGFEARA